MSNRVFVGDLLRGKENNFDFIRFMAAVLVVFTHSFAMSLGTDDKEPLRALTSQTNFGELAVIIFFISSGILITMSFDRSKDIVYYAQSRILRIFPALIFVVFLTVFALGPFVSSYSVVEYFTNPQTYTYLKAVFLHPMQYNLPGVFESNIYPKNVNGSLWTLEFEFVCYIVVAILGLTKLLNRTTVLILFVLTFSLSVLDVGVGERWTYFFRCFSAGMVIYLFRDKIPLNGWLAGFSLVALIASAFTPYLVDAFILFGGYLLIYFALSRKLNMHSFGKYGDFSYGIYIFGAPIQQTVAYLNGGSMNPFVNFLISLPITILFAMISWNLIEKRALSLKNYRVFNSLIPALKKSA